MTAIVLGPTILLLLSFVPLLLGNETTKAYGHFLLFTFTLAGALTCYRRKDFFLFVTPNALVFFYMSLSMALGAWGFSTGHVIALNVADYRGWQCAHIALTLIMLCLSIMLSVDYYHHDRYLAMGAREGVRVARAQLLGATILIPFFFIEFDLALLGGDGDLAILPKSVFALICILYASKFAPLTRWVFYLAVVTFFATFSVHEKREAIFLIFPMVYLELLRTRHQLSLEVLRLSVVITAFLLALILMMSVARGYGDFGEFDNLADALPLVIPYLNSEFFITGFLYNIEANYLFFHSMNSIELVLRDSDLLSLGTTILKPVFVLIPRYLLSSKPESIISLYTTAHDPGFRAIGGSWPISLLSELVWNFAYLAPLAAIALALLLVKLQRSMLQTHASSRIFLLGFLLYAYMHVITLARGSGIDQYVAYLLVGGVFFTVCMTIAAVLKHGARRPQKELGLHADRL